MSLKQQLKNCWNQNDKDIMIAYEEINVEQEKFSNDYEKFLLLPCYFVVIVCVSRHVCPDNRAA